MSRLRSWMERAGATVLVDGDAEVTALAIDSREVRPGTLFIARKGWYVDGHDYIPQALAQGAVALLVSRPIAEAASYGVPVFFVEHEDPALGLLAAEFYGHPTASLDVFGVTGTNGKTSTAWMLDHLLRAQGRKPALLSTIAYRVGERWLPAPNTTPDALIVQRLAREALDAGCDSLVMEVSSHGAAHGRIAGVRFRAAGFTNFSRDHLDFHGDEESYLRAKALLFSLYLRVGEGAGHALWVNGPQLGALRALCDDAPVLDEKLQHLRPLCAGLGAPPTATVIDTSDTATPDDHRDDHRDASIRVQRLERKGASGVTLRLHADGAQYEGALAAAGDFQVDNAALAMSMVQRVTGAPWPALLDAMTQFPGIPGRFELVADPAGDEPAVFVDYAHTPDAVRVALETARALDRPPLWAVVGAGGDRDRGKRPQMGRIASELADRTVLTSDNPRTEDPAAILDEVAAAVPPDDATVHRRLDRREAIRFAVAEAHGGTVLIAGKGHERYEEIQRRRYHWDDADEARIALATRRYGMRTPLRLAGWSARHLAQLLGGVWSSGAARPLFRGLSTDTRSLQPGDLFVALQGERFDAHTLVGAAMAAGASAAIVERYVEGVAIPQLRVESTHQALGALARALIDEASRGRAGLQLIAITGSNGKTTTRSFAEAFALLRDGRAPLATHGNFNNQIGLPLSVSALSTDHTRTILEMGANVPGDIAELVEMAPPQVAVLTSIGASHLAGFGSLDGVRAAKVEMLQGPKPLAVVMPIEERSELWGRVADAREIPVYTFGDHPDATLRATRDTVDGPVRLEGRGAWAGFQASVALPVPGRHNAGNLAAALLAVSVEQGALVPPPSPALLARFPEVLIPPAGRMERYDRAGRQVVYDAYNANPSSTRAALAMLGELPGPRVAVLGELFELGDEEAAAHADILREAAAICTQVVAVGPRWVQAGAENTRLFLDREAAAAYIIEISAPGTSLLWKGSRGARLEEIRDVVEAQWRKEAT